MKHLILFCLIVFISLSGMADERRALRLLEKRDYEKLVEVLEKDIDKDSISPGAHYIYSLLYNDPLFEAHDLDTSYYYILKAVKLFPALDTRSRDKLEKLEINDSTIQHQKNMLEYMGYQRATGENTIQAYNQYIHEFSASSYIDDAIMKRNELAFDQASRENTYQAYHQFILEYPGADQVDEAKKRYQRLLYEQHTRDDNLQSYEDFIKAYPDSPFKREAVEAIYQIRTSNNSEEKLLSFIRDFPDSEQVKDAISRLYHNYRSRKGADFSYVYNFISLSDSIKKVSYYVHQLLIPVYEEGRYGFLTESGEMLIPPSYDNIPIQYLCGDIEEDFLIIEDGGNRKIVGKTGALIYNGPFYNVEDIGYGLLKFSDNAQYGLLFKSGKIIFSARFDEIQRLDDQLIKVREGDEWRLFSLNGQLLLSENFQRIEKEGQFLLFQKGDQWAVSSNDQVMEWYRIGDASFRYTYDDYVLIEPTQILCFKDDMETVVDKNLVNQLPLEKQRVFALPEGWLVRKDNLYQLYDDAFYKISGSGFRKVEYKGDWISGKIDDKWILYHQFAPFPDVFAYDSINILNEQFVLVFLDEDPYLIFKNLKREQIHPYVSIRVLKHQPEPGEEIFIPEFLMVEYSNGRKSVYNATGREVINGEFNTIQALGPEYLTITKKGKVGLVDTAGHVLLKPQFDGIANYNNGHVSILQNKKFGIYNRRSNIYLKPEFGRILKPYNKQYLIANDDLGYGLIDHRGAGITDMLFEEIQYWNDTAILARESGFWSVYDITNKMFLLDKIYRFEFLKDEAEKIIIFRKEDLYGAVSNRNGFLINHSFNDIINLGNADTPIYFAEKYIPEAEFYIVIYYDHKGTILRKQVFTEEEYDNIYCN